MRYHKIRGVEKSICTAEQKIAYNVAFYRTDEYRDTWKKHKDEYLRFQQKEFILDAVKWCMRFIKMDEAICKKYDIDAIESALRNGLENYWNGKVVFSSYEEIGQTFPALYLDA